MENELYHHGIKGQKWGRRNGPPYPLESDQRSAEERKLNPRSSGGSNDSWGARNGLFNKNKIKKLKELENKSTELLLREVNGDKQASREWYQNYKEKDKLATQIYGKNYLNNKKYRKELGLDRFDEINEKINSDSWGARNGLFSKKKAYQKEYDALKKVYDATSQEWMRAEGSEKERLFKESSKLAAQLYDLDKQINSKSWGSRNGGKPIESGKDFVESFGVRNGWRPKRDQWGSWNGREIKPKNVKEYDLIDIMDLKDEYRDNMRNTDNQDRRAEIQKAINDLNKQETEISRELFGENYYFNNRWQQLFNDDENYGYGKDW